MIVDLTAADTQAAKVRLIGNSVCPEVAEALVRANIDASAEMRLSA
jgi:DNA (cytosine-5)-methyltransferase 1